MTEVKNLDGVTFRMLNRILYLYEVTDFRCPDLYVIKLENIDNKNGIVLFRSENRKQAEEKFIEIDRLIRQLCAIKEEGLLTAFEKYF